MKPTRLLPPIGLALAISACTQASEKPEVAGAVEPKPVCIRSHEIRQTSIPDNNTILFYMNDGKVWKNTLAATCYGLKEGTKGFTYSPLPSDEICSNLQEIIANDMHTVCLLGAFTPYTPTPGKE